MKLKFYEYEKCSTCAKARKWMEEKGKNFVRIPIRERTPSRQELFQLLAHHQGNLKKLLNTSSKDYRDSQIKDALSYMSENDVLDLLQKNGNLIKRPVLIGADFALQGFKSEEWEKRL